MTEADSYDPSGDREIEVETSIEFELLLEDRQLTLNHTNTLLICYDDRRDITIILYTHPTGEMERFKLSHESNSRLYAAHFNVLGIWKPTLEQEVELLELPTCEHELRNVSIGYDEERVVNEAQVSRSPLPTDREVPPYRVESKDGSEILLTEQTTTLVKIDTRPDMNYVIYHNDDGEQSYLWVDEEVMELLEKEGYTVRKQTNPDIMDIMLFDQHIRSRIEESNGALDDIIKNLLEGDSD